MMYFQYSDTNHLNDSQSTESRMCVTLDLTYSDAKRVYRATNEKKQRRNPLQNGLLKTRCEIGIGCEYGQFVTLEKKQGYQEFNRILNKLYIFNAYYFERCLIRKAT